MVYIVIVNWNSWQDTVECLESVFRNRYGSYRVIVCDNGSSDDSLERIRGWAEGAFSFEGGFGGVFRAPLARPIPYREYGRAEAEGGGGGDEVPLILIRTGGNLGFAGGNNVAIRYALRRGDFDYLWLLNNDTVIDPDALSQLVRRMEEVLGAGMCGSTMPYYHAPSRLWAQGGGTLNRWLAKSHCIGNGRPTSRPVPASRVERELDYIAGASLLVSRRFLEQVGLLCEEYFLYFEEPDWAMRARGLFSMAYAPESVVYHKVGASTDRWNRLASLAKGTDRFIFKSSLTFTRKFCPAALPLVFLRCSAKRAKGALLHFVLSRLLKNAWRTES